MFKNPFYRGALKALVMLVLYVVAARYTYGVVPLLVVLIGCAFPYNFLRDISPICHGNGGCGSCNGHL